MRQDDAELRRQVNEFLADYKKRGGFDKLADRYLSEERKEFQGLGYPFYF
jgi:polar amino acid transport system substrate-binding protein